MGFNDNRQNENHTAIERVVDELNETNITFDNYKRFGDRVDNNINIIHAQIENTRSQFTEIYEDFLLATKSDVFKRVAMDNLVPKDVFKMVISLNKILKETISWQEMKSSMYEIMYKKIYSIIDEANALTIKKEAIQEMREMEKERNKIITDTVTHKFGMIDERFDTIITSILESQKAERNEMMASFERLILKIKIQDVDKSDGGEKSVINNDKNNPKSPLFQPPLKHTKQEAIPPTPEQIETEKFINGRIAEMERNPMPRTKLQSQQEPEQTEKEYINSIPSDPKYSSVKTSIPKVNSMKGESSTTKDIEESYNNRNRDFEKEVL